MGVGQETTGGDEIKHITKNILGPCFFLSVRLLVSAWTRISTVAFLPKQKEFRLLLVEIHASLLSVFSSHSKHKLWVIKGKTNSV